MSNPYYRQSIFDLYNNNNNAATTGSVIGFGYNSYGSNHHEQSNGSYYCQKKEYCPVPMSANYGGYNVQCDRNGNSNKNNGVFQGTCAIGPFGVVGQWSEKYNN